MQVFITLVFILFFLLLFIFLITLPIFSCIVSTLSIIAYSILITVVFGLLPYHPTIPAIFAFDVYSALQPMLYALFFLFLSVLYFYSSLEKYFLSENFILELFIDIISPPPLSLSSNSSSHPLLSETHCQI